MYRKDNITNKKIMLYVSLALEKLTPLKIRKNQTTIYRLLKRHEWRKVMPRSHHPNADFEEQEKFKQEFPNLYQFAFKSVILDLSQRRLCPSHWVQRRKGD